MENKELKAEYDEKLALATLANSKGGKVVIASLKQDIANIVEKLATEYKTGDHFELVRLCSDLNASLNLYRALTRADGHVEELQQIIKDTLDE